MVSAMLQMLLLACFLPASSARVEGDLLVTPESPSLEIGSNFTATCVIVNTEDLRAEDLYWTLSHTTVPEQHYTKINRTAVSVTITVAGEKREWLFCRSRRPSQHSRDPLVHAVLLNRAYLPGKPENLSCVALQESPQPSSISCQWDPSGPQAADAPTTYTLKVEVKLRSIYNVSTNVPWGSVPLEVYPYHMILDIWVEARNILGTAESEHLQEDAGWFVKTMPPSLITVISEQSFPTSLLTHWNHPISDVYMKLIYEIRFCAKADPTWTYVPRADTSKHIESFRLQKLRADTLYIIQVRCKNEHGLYWSNWSSNVTKKTPEDRPTSKPNLWRIVAEPASTKEEWVQLVAKNPKFSNGRIRRLELKTEFLKDTQRNGSADWESIVVHKLAPDGGPGHHVLKPLLLPDNKSVNVSVIAINSMGQSPVASLIIPDKIYELPPVEDLEVRPRGGLLELSWRPSSRKTASEFVVEWSSSGAWDWQRESRGTTKTTIRGNLDRFVCYTISVYPIYSGWIGKARTTQAYLEQGAPTEGPGVKVVDEPGHTEAKLVWTEIPPDKRRGFITNYTIFYTSGSDLHNITVPADRTSHTLRSLTGNTKYDTWIVASTSRGSARGENHSFITQKYARGQLEAIIVGICLLFFFVFLVMALLCIYKEDMIRKRLWPQIPNPGESTIGTWSPDYPLKAETPTDSCVSGVSVLAVDVCDVQCVLEEDKSVLPLKRDKYLSEEHSSGIGGSSCMSSPRHSVSDSDEGSDGADTTASTVQYSSVVALGGYKGQTPASKLQQVIFSRSESTQPLLDSEEPPEAAGDPSRRAVERGERAEGGPPQVGALDFEPIMEEAAASAGSQAEESSYRPQRSGYRPQ